MMQVIPRMTVHKLMGGHKQAICGS